jgi:hypothetical protein
MPLLMSDPAATLRAGTMRGARKANLASGAWGEKVKRAEVATYPMDVPKKATRQF